ncbi:D-xylose 1-dehydrogenase Gfo6 [Halostagnicola kamekurae]|uniref:Xylose dehydrogenase (NAD/NADP) n=1 Tax=Halostagnicola kamekurae TaxID=619731 RepID=A0A1I6RRA0_9EURY|nr:D-xylose 1-dehydrogenase Gfo6 [Halostagnicola kamekurae]SFS67202.1 xylose dehydrogenase (NAD/NADP) [Halostagnicola kamekurae]
MNVEECFEDFRRRDWERESVDGTVRLAVVGIGGFAENRAIPGVRAGTYCEPTVLVTGSPRRTRPVADEFGVDHVLAYDDYLAGELEGEYDAVYVSTPNAFHAKYARSAAERGKHVICEKPLETSAERAREIADACARAGVTLMTAYRLQLEPTVRRCRELVAAGVIGDVVQVHGGFSHPLLEFADADTWRLDPDLAGGGALVDLGIYPINTTRYLLDADPVSAYASTHSIDDPFDRVDEHVSVQLEFPGDATAACTASFDAHASSQLQVVGTNGMISVSSPFGGVVPQDIVVESGEMRTEYTGPPVDEVREEFDYFGYCVLTGTRPEPDGADAIVDLRIIDAAYESAETECRVVLDPSRSDASNADRGS